MPVSKSDRLSSDPSGTPTLTATGMTKHAFISHSSEDHETALRICEVMESRGLLCWIAPRDIDPGAPYDEEIVRGIESSQSLILLLSDSANDSPHVKRELMLALRAGRAVYPIRIKAVEPGPKLQYLLEGIHWVDAWTPPVEAHLDRIAQLIAGTPSADAVAVPLVRRATKALATRKKRARIMVTTGALLLLVFLGALWLVSAQSDAPGQFHAAGAMDRETPGPRRRPGANTVMLSWAHDPLASKSNSASAQIFDDKGNVLGELMLIPSSPEDTRWKGLVHHAVTLNFLGRDGGTNMVCVFREDDAIGQVRAGSVKDVPVSAKVTEITRQGGIGFAGSSISALTIEATGW